jgi:hypothetical protein
LVTGEGEMLKPELPETKEGPAAEEDQKIKQLLYPIFLP